MSVSEEERRDAEKAGQLISNKVFAIMDLQADIDTLLQDRRPTPFGSKNWQYACLEAKQRVVAMTALQFLFYEPVGLVKGNDELHDAAKKVVGILIDQMKTLKTKRSDWL